MTIDVVEDQVIMTGRVEGNEHRLLQDMLDRHAGRITTIVLRDSPGGNADVGYAVGELIRERGLRTAVSGYCRSSCSRMFLGGKERYFTDEQPVGKTYVAFHGNYAANGALQNQGKLKAWVIRYSDGRADDALVERWVNLFNRRGFMYFFDSNRLKRSDGVSMFLCQGDEPRENRFEHCEKIVAKDAYSLGIATSSKVVHVKGRPATSEPGADKD